MHCNGVGRAVRVRLSVHDEVGDGLFQTEAQGVFGALIASLNAAAT